MPGVPGQGHDERSNRTKRAIRMHLRRRLLPRSHRSQHVCDMPHRRSVRRPVVRAAQAPAVQLHWRWANRGQLDPQHQYRQVCADELSSGL